MDDRKYDFFAFISYKREDEKWAKWLQRKLEYYKLPSSVRKDNPDLPEKIRPVFKDTTDLEPGVLARKIQDALDSSKYLIVICSPRSANSIWVSKEVQAFIDSGRSDHIIPFIIGGIPNAADPKDECFPEGLRQLAGEQELLGANINEMGREAAAIKVVARMFNLRFDTLWQRYERDKKRRQIGVLILAAIAVLSTLFIGYLFFDRNHAYVELDKTNDQLRLTILDLSKSRDSIRRGARNLQLASDSIKKSALQIQHTNRRLTIANKQLYRTTIKLEEEKSNLKHANDMIKIEQSNLLANQIVTDVNVGNAYSAKKLISGNFNSNNEYYDLPITPDVEKAIRLVHSLSYTDEFVHTNALDNIPFSNIVDDMCDSIQVFMDGILVTFSDDIYTVLQSVPCDRLNLTAANTHFAGFLDSTKTRCGVANGDSIYAYDSRNGKLLWKQSIYSPNVFRPLNDSVFVIPNVLGALDLRDSRNGNIVLTSAINDFRPLFTQSFRINDNNVTYVNNDGILTRRNLYTGDLIWEHKFDYSIDDEILTWNDYRAVGVINRNTGFLNLVEIDGWDVISSLPLRRASKYQLGCSERLSISVLSNNKTSLWYDSWRFPLVGISDRFYRDDRRYNPDMNYWEFNNNECYFVDQEIEKSTYMISYSENDAFRFIKSKGQGLLCICKIDGAFRLLYLFSNNDKCNLRFISDGDEFDYDWVHGYLNYSYHRLPKSLRSGGFNMPFNAWSQMSDISNNNEFIAAALYNNILYVKDVHNDDYVKKTIEAQVFSVRFAPDDKSLWVVTDTGVSQYDIDLNSSNQLINSNSNSSYCLVEPFKTKRLLALATTNGTIKIFSTKELSCIGEIYCGSTIIDMAISNDDCKIVSLLGSNEIVVYELNTFKNIYRQRINFSAINVNFNRTGDMIIVNAEDRSMLIPFESVERVIEKL